MKYIGIIPARFASTRFPGKPLVDIGGKTMIRRVYEQAKKSRYLDEVFVATDDHFIHNHVVDFGGNSVMTNPNHLSGTDRCYEAVVNSGVQGDVIINIQGDEPFMEPENIDLLIKAFDNEQIAISTLICPLTDAEQINSPNNVKVVVDNNFKALYFSRFPIPYLRNQTLEDWLKTNVYYQHLGIYGYRFSALEKIVAMSPSRLEMAESLEQLRWLEAGMCIQTCVTNKSLTGIDTPEDLKKALEFLKNQKYD